MITMESVSGLSFDFLQNDVHHEENEDEDDEEEVKQREKELQELLTTAFDDITDDDDDDDCVDKSVHLTASSGSLHPFPHQTVELPAYDTSTPHNERPPWTANFTPIAGQMKENACYYTPYQHTKSATCQQFSEKAVGLHMPNGCLSPVRENDSVHEECNYGTLMAENNYHNNRNQQSDFYSSNQQGCGDAQTLQERIPIEALELNGDYENKWMNMKSSVDKWKEEEDAKIRLLKHQLTLVQGEKEGLVFSLQQAQQLIVDKDRDISTLHKKMQTVEDALNKEKSTTNELGQKLEVSESLVTSLQQQVKELSSYKKLTNVQESQERLIHFMKEKHQKEVLELKEKLVQMGEELERTKGQLKFLEKYFQQTIPDRMAAINRLSQNLESVQNNCVQLLETDTMRDVEKLVLQQSEREKLQQLNNEKLQTLVEAIGDLGNKIIQSQNEETVPLTAHSKLLSDMEKQKNEYDVVLKNLNNKLEDFEDKNRKFAVENCKLKNEMDVVMKKHELLISSAIEKYHTLHKAEISHSRQELHVKFEEEKSNLCAFYEEKISDKISEIKDLTNSLNEVKEMYLKVCEERNEFESNLQQLNSEEKRKTRDLDSYCSQEVQKRLNEAKFVWEEAAEKKYLMEVAKAKAKWETEQTSAIKLSLQLFEEMFKSSTILFLKEKEKMCERLDALQTKFMMLQQSLKLQVTLRLEKEKTLHAHFLQEHNSILSHTRDELNHNWQEKVAKIEQLFRGKLSEVQVVHQTELDKIISEARKAMAQEKERLLKQHKENIFHLNIEIARLEKDLELQKRSKPEKHDAAVLCSLNGNTQNDSLQELLSSNKELNNQVQILQKEKDKFTIEYQKLIKTLQKFHNREKQLKKLGHLCQKCEEPTSERISKVKDVETNGQQPSKPISRNIYVQTEKHNDGISKEQVKELMKAYSDILRELTMEVTHYLSTASVHQSERLRSFIMQYYNNEMKSV